MFSRNFTGNDCASASRSAVIGAVVGLRRQYEQSPHRILGLRSDVH